MNPSELSPNCAPGVARVRVSSPHYASPLVTLVAFLSTAVLVAALSAFADLPVLTGLGIYSLIAGPICLVAFISARRAQPISTDAALALNDRARLMLDPETYWWYSTRLAASAFPVGGVVTYLWAWRTAFPPPSPPGTAECGLGVLVAPFILLFGPPIGATIASIAGGLVGAVLDRSLSSGKGSIVQSQDV